MSRFIAWFRWEWREHIKLVIGCALATVFITWTVMLIGRGGALPRAALEGTLVGELALMALVLAVGLFGSERRHGAEALLLRTPGARAPLFAARLAFFLTALAGVALVASFGAARLANAQSEAHVSFRTSPVGWLLWPRYILADVLVLALAMSCVGLLVSAWTRRVALAFVLALVLPALVLFPWIYLGALRGDFFPLQRSGAISAVAWPLLGLALVALVFSWFLGRRHLNRSRRALGLGVLTLLLGMGVAGAWTARAFASFDNVQADAPGFRLSSRPVDAHVGGVFRNSHLPLDSVALSPDGRTLWVQGYRIDDGIWPFQHSEVYGPHVRDFREDRGTWSRQWRIDLETGEARPIGEVRERIGWWGFGSGRMVGLLRAVDPSARLAPRVLAQFGRNGHSDEARVLDLNTGEFVSPTQAELDDEDLWAVSRGVVASATAVRDADGRPAWLEIVQSKNEKGEPLGGVAEMFLVTSAGRLPVEDRRVLATSGPYTRFWGAVPGGWSRTSGTPRFMTLDTSGRVRASTEDQLRTARTKRHAQVAYLDTRHVLVPTDEPPVAADERNYRVLDLETGDVGKALSGPREGLLIPFALPGGRLLCMEDVEGGRRLILWDAWTDKRTPIATSGDDAPLPADGHMRFEGADPRGNMVVKVYGGVDPELSAFLDVRVLYFHAATNTVTRLSSQTATVPDFQAIGIDAQDRVVGLSGAAPGFRTVVRFDPADGSRTVLFPKRERGPQK